MLSISIVAMNYSLHDDPFRSRLKVEILCFRPDGVSVCTQRLETQTLQHEGRCNLQKGVSRSKRPRNVQEVCKGAVCWGQTLCFQHASRKCKYTSGRTNHEYLGL